MKEIIKEYIVKNKNFFILLLVNFFAFYTVGEIYEFGYATADLKFFVYQYMFFLNILMILKDRKVLKNRLVRIAFLLLGINFLINNYLIVINFNIILGIIYIYIVVSNYKETDNSKNKVIYLIIPLFLECINIAIAIWYIMFLDRYDELVRKSQILLMLLPYIFMFPITVIALSKLKDMKKELKAIVISLLLTLLLYLILSLIDIENIIIMVTLFSVLYLFIRDKIMLLKLNKKIIMIYIFILAGICGYIYMERGEKAWIKLKGDYDEEFVTGYRDEKTGICYKRIGFKKLICGEIINGKKEGKWRGWYEDGKRKFEGNYVGDEKEGKWIEWYENGQKESEGIYKNGKVEGKWIEWYDTGEKAGEGIYRNGKKEGKWIYWYDNGNKKSEVTYKDDKEIERIKYDEDGNRDEDENRIE